MPQGQIVVVAPVRLNGRRVIIRTTGVLTIRSHLSRDAWVRPGAVDVTIELTQESVAFKVDPTAPSANLELYVPGGARVVVEQAAGIKDLTGTAVTVEDERQ